MVWSSRERKGGNLIDFSPEPGSWGWGSETISHHVRASGNGTFSDIRGISNDYLDTRGNSRAGALSPRVDVTPPNNAAGEYWGPSREGKTLV